MKRVLLTGMSGTGKSSIVQELGLRGYKAVDTDYGWSEEVEVRSGDAGTVNSKDWLWREDRITELLTTQEAANAADGEGGRDTSLQKSRTQTCSLFPAPRRTKRSSITGSTTSFCSPRRSR